MQGDEIFYEYNPKCTVQFLFHLLSTTVLSILIMSCFTLTCSCRKKIQTLQEENKSLKNLIINGIEEHLSRSLRNTDDSDCD